MRKKEIILSFMVVSSILLLSNVAITILNQGQTTDVSTYEVPLMLGAASTNETITVKRTCPLTPKYTSAPLIQVKKSVATHEEILELANKYGGLTSSADIRDFGGGDIVIFGRGKSFHTNGLNNFMLSYEDIKNLTNTMSEAEAKKVADEFVNGLLHDNPDFPCTVEYYKTVTGCRTLSKKIETGEVTEIIHTLKVKYKILYEGIPIYGNGAGVSVSVCNNKIVEFEVHMPEVVTQNEVINVKPPDQAFQEMLDEPRISFSILFERNETTFIERHVDNIELCYYYDFTNPEPVSNVALFYLISGTDYLKTTKAVVQEETFSSFIDATP